MKVILVNKNNKVMHDVDNDNGVEIENVVVNGFHHDCESKTVMIGTRRDVHANVSPLCNECPEENCSAFESDDVSEVHHA